MFSHKYIFPITLLLLGLALSSCSSTKDLKSTEFMLTRNRINVDRPSIGTSDLQGFIQQKPNKRLLGVFRVKQWTYIYASQGKTSRFKTWMLKSFADKTVVLDSQLVSNSTEHMKAYLNNIGFFHSSVTADIHYSRKKASVSYNIKSGEPYRIRHYARLVPDDSIKLLIDRDENNVLIKKGDIYNVYTIDKERERINMLLKNNGYYRFSKDYLSFRADSALGTNQIDIKLIQSNPFKEGTDSIADKATQRHQVFHIKNVNIFPDYNPVILKETSYDTVHYLTGKNFRDDLQKKYILYFHKSLIIKPGALTQNIFILPGDLFRLDDVNQTFTRLNDLQLYRFVNIEFVPARDTGIQQGVLQEWLDCNIQLSRNKLQAISPEAEGTNNGGDFGLAANVVYENRNIFRGAELFNLRLKGAMEIQKRFSDELNNSANSVFNTYETGLQASLVFPKFLLPVNPERFSRYFRPKTTLNAGLNYLERSNIRRYRMEVAYGYDWKQSAFKRHLLFPVEINSISVFPDSSFTQYLISLNDKRLTDQYTDHLIMAMRYSYIFNNQRITRKEDFYYFRGNLESAGNLITGINEIFHSLKDKDGQYTIFNIKYSQYLKGDGDFRYYNLLGEKTLVYRAAVGLGYPYGNASSLPFDKGFYSGGANGMRGWAIRSLGPGSYNDEENTLKYDKMGDVFLESNLELRFPIAGWFKGALFADAGNIWLLKPNDQFPEGEFRWDVFYNQLALDAGLGLRLDFSFFVFRLDGALQLRNPALPRQDKWVNLGKVSPASIMWNFGIGYPF